MYKEKEDCLPAVIATFLVLCMDTTMRSYGKRFTKVRDEVGRNKSGVFRGKIIRGVSKRNRPVTEALGISGGLFWNRDMKRASCI